MRGVLESISLVHGLIETSVHTYSLKCSGCYMLKSGTLYATLYLSNTVYVCMFGKPTKMLH